MCSRAACEKYEDNFASCVYSEYACVCQIPSGFPGSDSFADFFLHILYTEHFNSVNDLKPESCIFKRELTRDFPGGGRPFSPTSLSERERKWRIECLMAWLIYQYLLRPTNLDLRSHLLLVIDGQTHCCTRSYAYIRHIHYTCHIAIAHMEYYLRWSTRLQ